MKIVIKWIIQGMNVIMTKSSDNIYKIDDINIHLLMNITKF